MARQPRLQFSGAHYLICNHGDPGRDIFMQCDAKELFQEALAEACQRNGWKLFAFAILRNRYFLVIETPKGNLTEGMQWLQSAFSNRLNLRRQTKGHIFVGRYKAQLVEPNTSLLNAVDFVHMAPIRSGLVDWDNADRFSSVSYWHYLNNGSMRAHMNSSGWLKYLGIFHDDFRRIWPLYRNHLMNVYERTVKESDDARNFLSGWVIGSKDFRKRMVAKLKEGQEMKDWGGSAMREINEVEWEEMLEQCLEVIGKTKLDIATSRKSASWKIAIAAYMKSRTSVSNPWLGEYLNMGAPAAVSRYVGTFLRMGGRMEPLYQELRVLELESVA